jgi:hypothetical protein
MLIARDLPTISPVFDHQAQECECRVWTEYVHLGPPFPNLWGGREFECLSHGIPTRRFCSLITVRFGTERMSAREGKRDILGALFVEIKKQIDERARIWGAFWCERGKTERTQTKRKSVCLLSSSPAAGTQYRF